MPKTCEKWQKVSNEVYLDGRERNPYHPTPTLHKLRPKTCEKWQKVSNEVYLDGRERNPYHPKPTLHKLHEMCMQFKFYMILSILTLKMHQNLM